MARRFPLEIVINAIDKLSGPLAETSRKLDRFGNRFKRMGEGFTKGVTLPLGLVGGIALRSAASLESLETRFKSLTGSAEKAAIVTKQLAQFAADTPFDLLDVGNAGAQLLAAGFALEEMIPNLKILGDVAAGAGTNLQDMVPLFTEIRLKGKAFTQDLRQFATRGIPIVAVLAKHLGKSEEKIFDLASKGKITFPLIQKALESMTREGGLFANQMEEQSKTLGGLFNAAKDAWNISSGVIGEAITEATNLKDVLRDVQAAAGDFAKWFKGLPGPVRNAAVYVGLFAFALGPVLIGLGQFIIIGGGLILVISKLTKAIGLLKLVTMGGFAAFVLIGGALAIAWFQMAKLKDMAGSWGQAFLAVLYAIGVAIGDFLIFPFQQFIRLIRAPLNLVGVKTPTLDKMANFTFGDMAADSLARNMGNTPYPAGPGAAANNAMANASLLRVPQGETTVKVDFTNLPKGTRVETTSKGNVKTDVTQGVSMGAGG